MRKIFAILPAILFCSLAQAQDERIVNELTSMLDRSQVIAHYSYSDASGAELGKGVATIQGRKYTVAEGKALFISNGATLWSVFADKKEVYVENAGGRSDIFSNIPEIIKQVEDLRWDGSNLSFTMNLEGLGKLLCKARVQETPWNDEAKFTVSDDILGSKDWIVTDLR
ncbi:MAG: hypothetical protein J6X82_06100 [Bacteroidales bacterium]|nr:hypothetical protein [Bacteroidales bacterium]